MSRALTRVTLIAGIIAVAIIVTPILAFVAVRWYYDPDLPSVDALRELKLEVPMRVFTRDGRLIGEFGAERRAPMRYEEFPQRIIDAFLAAEDDRFFEHPGVDWQGLLRASLKLAATGEKSQGGSTITMQLARNVYLTPERSYTRKVREILLAMRIEREMTKQQILETYLNKIFLGQRAYGVGAASRVYFGREPKELTWAQASLLAGLPKAPSRDNPVTSPERARERRDYVLRRLRELGKISDLEYEAGLAEPVVAKLSPPQVDTDARYVAEMARAELFEKYGESAYRAGYRVTTTVDSARQDMANRALRTALLAYDERHGYRGPEARLPPELVSESTERRDAIGAILDARPVAAGLYPAAVVSFSPAKLTVLLQGSRLAELSAEDFRWAGLTPRNALKPGDIVRVRPVGDRWRLTELPEVQGALVAIDPRNGAIQAATGGYDFLLNKYNRVTQARRQSGSGFKPFLYASAFESGYTPASVFLDAPVVFADASLEGEWRPENYDGDFKGPMRLREALVHSRNLVSIRVLQAVGLNFAREYIPRFGFPKERIPRDLSMALGSGSFTPLEMARGYSVLANGGYRVDPYLVDLVQDSTGKEIFRANPPVACDTCTPDMIAAAGSATGLATDTPPAEKLSPRVIDPRVAWMVDDILREVTIRGTAAQARALGRTDIAGKTGTTNDETDAWFNGFTGELVAVCWVGFDQPTPLGRGEVGGKAALPMWMDFMGAALKDHPDLPRPRPAGMVSVRIDRETGFLASGGDPGAITEVVPEDRVPRSDSGNGDAPTGVEDIF